MLNEAAETRRRDAVVLTLALKMDNSLRDAVRYAVVDMQGSSGWKRKRSKEALLVGWHEGEWLKKDQAGNERCFVLLKLEVWSAFEVG